MNTGKSVALALIAAGKKKADLARDLNVSKQHISQLCKSGDASTSSLRLVAKALDMKVSELISLSENNDANTND